MRIERLTAERPEQMWALLDVFAAAFDDPDNYLLARPDRNYLTRLMARNEFIALAAIEGELTLGGLCAYELMKFEQARSEIYIYDLAVTESHRRRGIATALIEELRRIARARGASVIYVQADYGDEPAVALYTKLGTREDVMHFDIEVAAV